MDYVTLWRCVASTARSSERESAVPSNHYGGSVVMLTTTVQAPRRSY